MTWQSTHLALADKSFQEDAYFSDFSLQQELNHDRTGKNYLLVVRGISGLKPDKRLEFATQKCKGWPRRGNERDWRRIACGKYENTYFYAIMMGRTSLIP